MAVKTIFHAPLAVQSPKIFQVIGKMSGSPWQFITEGSHDLSQPSSPSNPWSIDMGLGEAIQISAPITHATSFLSLLFHDLGGSRHEWSFENESETEHSREIRLTSTAFGVAIGRRLLGFFGGELQYRDVSDDSDETLHPRHALFPPRQPHQSVTDRHHQFQNALAKISLLSVAEINAAAPFSEHKLTERCERFQAERLRFQLQEALPPAAMPGRVIRRL